MLEQLIEFDKKLLLFFNGLHTPWLDQAMFTMSKTFFWIPLFALLLYWIIREYKWNAWMVLIGIGLTVLLADQITSTLMKPFFARPRPSNEPTLTGLVHLVNDYHGGKYGFASSHAANTFGVAAFVWLLFRKNKKWIALLFVWALVVTYTRIYLGVHYPGDVLVGGMVGIACAVFSYWIYDRLRTTMEKRNIAKASATNQ